jgi:hypothetical protein
VSLESFGHDFLCSEHESKQECEIKNENVERKQQMMMKMREETAQKMK